MFVSKMMSCIKYLTHSISNYMSFMSHGSHKKQENLLIDYKKKNDNNKFINFCEQHCIALGINFYFLYYVIVTFLISSSSELHEPTSSL